MSVAGLLAADAEFDIESIDEDEDEDEDDGMELSSDDGIAIMKPPTARKSSSSVSRKSVKDIQGKKKVTRKVDSEDPATCGMWALHLYGHQTDHSYPSEFSIPSAIKCKDGSYAPVEVTSTITYEPLLKAIAEELNRFPGLIELRYRLEGDKPKVGATTIKSEVQLEHFKQRMRLLIVPQRLANGKISQRQLKPIRVYFEDAAEDIIERSGKNLQNKSAENKVRHGLATIERLLNMMF
jgi:hypothetical protein